MRRIGLAPAIAGMVRNNLTNVVMTTRAADKHRQIATNLGANAYITKPIEERSLVLEVAQCLESTDVKV